MAGLDDCDDWDSEGSLGFPEIHRVYPGLPGLYEAWAYGDGPWSPRCVFEGVPE